MIISIRCLEDCNADIVYQETNRFEYKCWNCNRIFAKDKKGNIVVKSGPGFTQYSPIREEIAEVTKDGKVLE